MKNQIAAMILLAAITGAPLVNAGEITLKSHDGSISLTGELVSYDGKSFIIRSEMGEVTFEASQVECIGADCPVAVPANTAFVISGSKTVGSALLPTLVEAFAFDQNGSALRIAGSAKEIAVAITADGSAESQLVSIHLPGSTGGVAELVAGTADIAVLSRPLSEAEIQAIGGVGEQIILALDGLVPVVAAGNALRSISEQDLASVFSGGVVNWADLGVADAPIKLYMREPDSGTRAAFELIVMDEFIAELSDEATILLTDEEIADAVAADPNAIGIVSLAAARNARILPILGICGIETQATPFTIKTEEYPLSRRIFAVKPAGETPPAADSFLNYIQSDAAQYEIADAGFVDQLIEPTPVSEQGTRFATALVPGLSDTTLEQLQGMMANLVLAQRLSVTFRFVADSDAPDERAKDDILRFVNVLASGAYDGKEIILAGFTDSEGSMSKNRDLSATRATQIRDALLAAAPAGTLDQVPLTVVGYGEASPLACNEITSGRAVNRRVEVWVKDKAP